MCGDYAPITNTLAYVSVLAHTFNKAKKVKNKNKKKHESCIKKDKSKQSYGKNQTITKQQGSQTSSLTNTI